MNARVEKLKKLVKYYRAIKSDYPNAVILTQLKKSIFSEIMQDAQALDNLQSNFLKHLHALISSNSKENIEKAIKDRDSIKNFTRLEDYNFKTLSYDKSYDKKRVDSLLRGYKVKASQVREAIIIEASLHFAQDLASRAFYKELTTLAIDHPVGTDNLLGADHPNDPIQRLLEMEFDEIIDESCVKALARVCKNNIKMKLKDPLKGYQFKEDFVQALAAHAFSKKPPTFFSSSPPFSKRHPALYFYLITMTFILGLTGALVGLCFVPVVGPILSSSLGAFLGGIGATLGIEATLEALTTGVALGLSVTLTSASALLSAAFFGAVNAVSLTFFTALGKFISILRANSASSPKELKEVDENNHSRTTTPLMPLPNKQQKQRIESPKLEPNRLRRTSSLPDQPTPTSKPRPHSTSPTPKTLRHF